MGGSKEKLGLCIGYNMGKGGLPDVCTRCPRATGPRAMRPEGEGVYIRQATV